MTMTVIVFISEENARLFWNDHIFGRNIFFPLLHPNQETWTTSQDTIISNKVPTDTYKAALLQKFKFLCSMTEAREHLLTMDSPHLILVLIACLEIHKT